MEARIDPIEDAVYRSLLYGLAKHERKPKCLETRTFVDLLRT